MTKRSTQHALPKFLSSLASHILILYQLQNMLISDLLASFCLESTHSASIYSTSTACWCCHDMIISAPLVCTRLDAVHTLRSPHCLSLHPDCSMSCGTSWDRTQNQLAGRLTHWPTALTECPPAPDTSLMCVDKDRWCSFRCGSQVQASVFTKAAAHIKEQLFHMHEGG